MRPVCAPEARKLLALRCPDPPGSLRVVPKAGVLELEVGEAPVSHRQNSL